MSSLPPLYPIKFDALLNNNHLISESVIMNEYIFWKANLIILDSLFYFFFNSKLLKE